MNIQQLRQSLKMKWLNYYKQNRPWLVKMRVWATYNGLRRPSSGFILATLSVLEPEFDQVLAFMMDLNNNPDAIVTALGLNFNPDEELPLTNLDNSLAINQSQNEPLAVTRLEEEPVRMQSTVTKIIPQPLATLPNTEKTPSDLPKPLPAFAVATKVNLLSSAKRSRSVPLATGVLLQTKPVRSLALTTTLPSNGKTLALAIEIPGNSKLFSRRTIATETSPANAPEIPNQVNTLSSLPVNLEMPNNGKLEKLQPQNPPNKNKSFPHTNARSLASWVDEFCQGKAWEQ
ncbi:DUF5331 domain-containing protein [Nostoc sp. FACHB-145]|uniref:DUF5331 domain-containing protein n=1 Tax=Nostoc sp. FACHB-145 TaxID=2692836 RepID=UPI0016875BAD|nr:DUF5331 domain-containing protein [Nostoc sp. FACHB-145]MBD2470041.1 hypothetical protein [Nostoc sp. FACHB-145]